MIVLYVYNTDENALLLVNKGFNRYTIWRVFSSLFGRFITDSDTFTSSKDNIWCVPKINFLKIVAWNNIVHNISLIDLDKNYTHARNNETIMNFSLLIEENRIYIWDSFCAWTYGSRSNISGSKWQPPWAKSRCIFSIIF